MAKKAVKRKPAKPAKPVEAVATEPVEVPPVPPVDELRTFGRVAFQSGPKYRAGFDVDAASPGALGRCERIELDGENVLVTILLPCGKRQVKTYAGWPCELTEA